MPAPNAKFTYAQQSGTLVVKFTNTSTNSTSYVWDFGDSSSGPDNTKKSPSHTYAAAGDYTVSLTATGPGGTSAPLTKPVHVADIPPQGPHANFTFNVATASFDVQFNDTSTAGAAPITGWSWDFGDGNTSTDQNPHNVYAAAGTYTVKLTVTDGNGNTDSVTKQVTVPGA